MPITVAPGSVVQVRDEEWLVSTVDHTDDGQLLTVQGLSGLVRGTTATFYENLDTIIPLDPHDATPVTDGSPTIGTRGCGWRRRYARPQFPSKNPH
ncbi:hypothetical protein [Cutibacterium sp.]|uniref:hypothetical protein n=1 Tax=Cutibacterium sp. TaxID=1912221 RepID=UPI0034C6D22F